MPPEVKHVKNFLRPLFSYSPPKRREGVPGLTEHTLSTNLNSIFLNILLRIYIYIYIYIYQALHNPFGFYLFMVSDPSPEPCRHSPSKGRYYSTFKQYPSPQ